MPRFTPGQREPRSFPLFNVDSRDMGVLPRFRIPRMVFRSFVTTSPLHLSHLDYSVLQQCIHCGMCLPTCPTYDATKMERNSPRGRIALMRSVAEGKLEGTQA